MSWFTSRNNVKRAGGGSGSSSMLACTPTMLSPDVSAASPAPPTPENSVLFQAFEWHTASRPPEHPATLPRESHWLRLARVLPDLAELGVGAVWIPPGCKANNARGSNGYDCYDLWDLGEFEQKGAQGTKWGSCEELRELLRVARECGASGSGVSVIWDAVLNHKAAGDATEEVWAAEVDEQDRRIEMCAPKKIEAWLRYDFPGRATENMKYSGMKWRAEHFNGTDWDQRAGKAAVYKLIDAPATHPRPNIQQLPIPTAPTLGFNRLARLAGEATRERTKTSAGVQRPGKGWAEDVDQTNGNYDYLMFSNVDYRHPEVREETLRWGEWMIRDTGVSGFRLDAAQHISRGFLRQWIAHVHATCRAQHARDVFVVGEVWAGETSRLVRWLDGVAPAASAVLAYAFDVPLLYSFSRLSEDVRRASRNADLRTLLEGPGDPDRRALVSIRPRQAVTFVTNHDTQPGQTSFVPMDSDLKALFYALILLRRDGYPCVFWGDLYGTLGDRSEGPACRVPSFASLDPDVVLKRGRLLDSSGSILPSLMLARKLFAYGPQTDYFDSAYCVGWTRHGSHDRPGCAVILSVGPADKWTSKDMVVGRPGEKWIDVLSDRGSQEEVLIDRGGVGVFRGRGRSVSVYVNRDCDLASRFPVDFDHDVYRP